MSRLSDVIGRLAATIESRRGADPASSWSAKLLADPALRPLVAGVSEAHRKHGGEGALYVAIKKKAETPSR